MQICYKIQIDCLALVEPKVNKNTFIVTLLMASNLATIKQT